MTSKKELIRLKKEAIQHYQRMINYSKTCWGMKYRSLMIEAIGEDWFGAKCPFCTFYINNRVQNIENNIRQVVSKEDYADPCPLATKVDKINIKLDKEGSDCSYGICCDGFWQMLNNTHTWEQFTTIARLLQKYIRRVMNEKIRNYIEEE